MTFWRNLLVIATLPALAVAAEPDMMNLVMPDASTIFEIDIAKIMASPFGSAIRDAVHQGVATQLKGELAKAKPEAQAQIAMLSAIDWSQEVQDVLVARGSGKNPATLVIVRSALDASRIKAIPGFRGDTTDYEGVTLLTSSKPDNGVIAFLDNSLVLLGQLRDVQAAIQRRGRHTVLPAALAAQVAKYKNDDVWLASTEVMALPAIPPAAAKSPAAAQVTQFFEKVAGLNGGLRFSPDFDLAADLEARTEKGAAEMLQGMRFLTAAGGSNAKGLQLRASGKHILLSLHVPEAEMLAGLKQIRPAQTARSAQTARPTMAAKQGPVVAPSSGLPPPPAGTIRVQSSDMGTVLLPVDKPR